MRRSSWLVVAVATCLIGGPAAAIDVPPRTPRTPVRAGLISKSPHDGRHVLVRLRDQAQAHALYRAAGGRVANTLSAEGVDVVRVGRGVRVEALAARLRADPRVEFAEPNYRRRISAVPDDPLFGDQWGLANTGQLGGGADADIDAPEGWELTGRTGPFAVGVVDTGVDAGHEDLAGKVVAPCFTALSGSGVLTEGCEDDNGHGTHVAGLIAATANNGTGIAGVAWEARIHACKAFDSEGAGLDADIIACVNEILSKRGALEIRVVNLSHGSPEASAALRAAVDAAAAAGVLPVAAAGNLGSRAIQFPAGFPSVVSVGATDRGDGSAAFSTFNDDVEISAPGVAVLSTVPGGYEAFSGTSFAAPLVTAVAAVIGRRTARRGHELRGALDAAVDDLGPPGRDPHFGFGRVNLCKALAGSCPYVRGVPSGTGVLSVVAVRQRLGGLGRPTGAADVCVAGPAGDAARPPASRCRRVGRSGRVTFVALPLGAYEVSGTRFRKPCRGEGAQIDPLTRPTAAVACARP